MKGLPLIDIAQISDSQSKTTSGSNGEFLLPALFEVDIPVTAY